MYIVEDDCRFISCFDTTMNEFVFANNSTSLNSFLVIKWLDNAPAIANTVKVGSPCSITSYFQVSSN